MGLNVDLVSQFAKLTANKKETKKESTAWGKVVEVTESGKCFVQLDGSDRITPVETMTEAKVGDRVAITVKNHAATLTGNTSSPSINADGSTIGSIRTDFKNISADNVVIRGLLTASEARIDELTAKNVTVEGTLEAHTGKFTNLEASVAEFERLSGTYATFEQLTSQNAEFRNLLSDYATIENLKAANAKITDLVAEDARIVNLFAGYATIGELDAKFGKIDSLIFGAASGTTIHTSFANAVIAQLGDAQIKSAMIKDLSSHTITASQITSGDIITDNINVKSQDGKLLIADQTIQISDASRVRVQIGKDAANDYSINIWDASGKLMFSEGGLTEDAVKEQIIRNDMVKDDANISASKLDIDTLFNVINEDGSHTLKSNKIKFDESNQTLDVAFGALTTKVNGQSETITSQGTAISVIQGNISSKIWKQDITSAINDISIGGRNLLVNTGRDGTVKLNVATNPSYQSANYANSGGLITLTCSSTSQEIYYRFMIPLMSGTDMYGLEVGGTYTLSGKAKVSTTSGTLINVVARSQDRVGAWGGGASTEITDKDSDEWISFKSTFTIREGAQCCYTSIQVYFEGSWAGVIQLKELKFEKGNKATDWTPAPEDTDNNIRNLSTQYSTLNQTIEGISATVGKHTTDFNNLSIGGRNLIAGTSLNTVYSGVQNPDLGYKDVWSAKTIDIPTGTEYIASFDAKADENIDIHCFFHSPNTTLTSESSTGDYRGDNGIAITDGVSIVRVTPEWKRYWVKWTQTPATNNKSVIIGRNFSATVNVYIRAVKLEIGNHATDWSPAPEDVDADITAVAASVSTAETKIDQNAENILLRATKTELSDGIDAAKSYANAQIQLASNAINLSVENISRSGRNLATGTSQKDIELGGYPTSGHSEGVGGKTTIVPTGNEYVLSFEAKSTVANDRIRCFFYSPNTTTKAVTSTGDETTSADGNCYVQLTTSWKRYWVKYTQTGSSTTSQKNWIVGRRYPGGSGVVSVRCIKLEAGHNPTPWSAAPEDTDGKISSVRSEIQALADSITLSVSGGLGGTASIKLSANGETTTQSIDMSKVRQAFANDQTGITISAGTVRFNANTLLVESTNFKLDASGNLEATNAKLSGDLTTIYNDYKAELSAGDLTFYYDNSYSGMISTKMLPGDTDIGLHIMVPKGYNHGLRFLVRNDAGTSVETLYHMDTLWLDDPSLEKYCYKSGRYVHNFNRSVEFLGITRHESPSYFDEVIYMGNNASIGWLDKDDKGPWQLITFTDTNTLDIGDEDYTTNISGYDVKIVADNMPTVQGTWVELNATGTKIRMYLANRSTGIMLDYNTGDTTNYDSFFYPINAGKTTLGKSANPFYRAYVKVAENVVSDIRAKENIVPIGSSLTRSSVDVHSELFDRLIPVQYNLINDGSRVHYGFIAQQVSAAMAELGIDESELDLLHHSDWIDETTGEYKDQYSLVYQNFIALLVHEVQKLKTEIKILKGE